MRKLLTLVALVSFGLFQQTANAQCADGEVEFLISSSGGDYAGEKWLSITTEENGSGELVWSQGNGTIGNGSGLLSNEPVCLMSNTTYYINAYDQYDDSWDGTIYEVVLDGVLIANNGGESPDDVDDSDPSFNWDASEEELESSEAFFFDGTSKDITAFSHPAQTGEAVIDFDNKTIDLEVSGSTDLTTLVVDFSLSPLAEASVDGLVQEAGTTENDFTTSITYGLTAFDGSTEDWSVTVTSASISSENDLLTFSIDGIDAVIDGNAFTLDLPYSSFITNLSPVFTISEFATLTVGDDVQESGVSVNDFTDALLYVVTAEDGTSQEYTITVTVEEAEPGVVCSSAIELTLPVEDLDGTTEGSLDDYTDLNGCNNNYIGGDDLVYTFTIEEASFLSGSVSGSWTGVSIMDGCPGSGGSCIVQGSGLAGGSFSDEFLAAGDYYAIVSTYPSPQFTTFTLNLSASSATDFLSFSFEEETGPAIIDTENHTIDIEVNIAADVNALIPIFEAAGTSEVFLGGVIQISEITANDYANTVIYTVIAPDGSEQNWTVNVTAATALSDQNEIISYAIDGNEATIDGATITLELPYTYDASDLIVDFEISPFATVAIGGEAQVSGETANNFTEGDLVYTVTAEDGTTQDFIVSVTVGEPGLGVVCSSAEELVFPTVELAGTTVGSDDNYTSLDGCNGNYIGGDDYVYTFTTEDGGILSGDITGSWVGVSILDACPDDGGTCLGQGSGSAGGSFSEVVLEPGTYFVVVSSWPSPQATTYTLNMDLVPLSSETDFLTFDLEAQTGNAVIDTDNNTIDVEISLTADITSIIPTFTISEYATAAIGDDEQISGTTQNDYTNAVVYTITAQDGTVQDWTITVTSATSLSDSNDLLTFAVSGNEAVIDGTDVSLELPYNFDASSLTADFTISPFAFATVAGDDQESGTTENDFSNPVVYTITAEDGTTQDYTVTVTVLDPAPGVLCETAIDLVLPAVDFVGNTEGSGDDYTTTNGCSNNYIGGDDLVYTIDIETTGLLSGAISGSWTGVTVMDGCPDDEDASCVAQGSGSAGGSFTDEFIEPGTYYVIVSTYPAPQATSFTLNMDFTPVSVANDILSFSFEEETGAATIDTENHTIEIEVGFTADITNLVASFTISDLASINITGNDQESGVTTNDFSSPVVYTVEAESGDVQDWTVTVTGVATPWTFDVTGSSHTILIPEDLDTSLLEDVTIEAGDFFAVFYGTDSGMTNGGVVEWTGTNTVLTAFGADAGDNNGFQTGETFMWMVWDTSEGMSYPISVTYEPIVDSFTHQGEYAENGISGLLSAIPYVEVFNQMEIPFNDGWGIMSSFMMPDSPNFNDAMGSASNMYIMKNGLGDVYWPTFGINSIGELTAGEGYFYNNVGDDTFIMGGTQIIPEDTPLTFTEGWSIIGYLRTSAASIETLMQPIADDIFIVKDENGAVYWPAFDVNGIANMTPGKGYQLKMTNEVSYTYPSNQDELPMLRAAKVENTVYTHQLKTANNMTIGIPAGSLEGGFVYGDEIGVFDASGTLVGSTVYTSGNMAVSVWGDDEITTATKEGMAVGEDVNFRLYRNGQEFALALDQWDLGNGSYQTNAVMMVENMRLSGAATTAVYELSQNEPNPSNTSTRINFFVPENVEVNITVYNMLGEQVAVLTNEQYETGYHNVLFNTSSQGAGTYFYRMTAGTFTATKQMNIIK